MLTQPVKSSFALDVSDLFQAYFDCRKNKRNSRSALLYEENFEERIFSLYDELINRSYTPRSSDFFIVLHPKPREIWAAQFEDRIIHHLFYNKFYSTFTNSFIHDSYSCIPGKGTLNAAKRLDHFVRSSTKNYSVRSYYLQCDIKSFFTSINKDVLFFILSKKIKEDWWVWLTKTIVYNDPTKKFVYKSPKNKQKLIPPHKSLFNASESVGLPIGNLTSQFFSNIILNELDQYCKHTLKCKHYIRYADDIVILHNDPNMLNWYYEQMCNFVATNLLLNFNPAKKIVNKTETGINFLGYIIKHYRIYVRRKIIHNMFISANINNEDKEKLRSSINSYFGLIRHANTFNQKIKFVKVNSNIKFDRKISKVIL